MLTTFDQVREWITDNGIKRWVLYKDRSKAEKITDSQYFSVSDMEDKMNMTEKYLRMSGGNAYITGSSSNSSSDLNVCIDVRLQDITPLNSQAAVQNVGAIDSQTIGQLRESITKELEAKWELKQYAKEKAEFERERKEFYDQRNGIIGAVVKALSPYLPAINGALDQRRMVAGVDTEEPVHAAPIVPDETQEAPEEEQQEQSPFTDEQEEKIYGLMVRFAKVEPDYMQLLEAVVKMAESGDMTYKMAKGALLK